ncbi:MAG: RICIN domain-containing protein [Clostridia bacterium]|nr:RICIN domain-containing protein [Clostridia bacterium]
MKKRTLKAIGFLMTLVMLFGLVTAYPTMSAEEPVLDAEQLLPDAMQEVTVPAEPSLPTEIPTELISDSKIAEAGHVRRLPQAEGDMNTVMLANEDGTHSMYLFSYPVKYTGENGNVYDKSNRLTAHSRSGYAYVNEENDIQTHLPTDITKNPVMLTYGDYAVATYIGTESLRSTAQLQNENTVLYTGAFGADTAVRYTADFSGYKEDVILYSSSAPTSFTFLLRPAGLVPVAENGVIRYQDKDTGETVLTTSPFYIYDSAENPNSYIDTDFSLEELTGGIYVLTVTLDAEYLATEGLTYPIYVDPSVYYASTGDVETTAVYSGSTMLNQPCGNELYHYVGYREMPYSQGRMLVRLNALKDNVLFRSLSADQVTSVTLNLMSAGGGGSSSTVIMAYQFTGADSWTPTGATFSGVQASSYALPYCGTTMAPDDSVCSLNVTSIAEGWLGFTEEATTKASQGIILLNSNSVYPEFSRRFYGSQSFTGVLPTVTVTYTPTIQDGTYYIRNSATETYMKKGGTTEGSSVLTDSFDVDASKWTITLQSTGYYTIKTASQNLYLGIDANDTAGTSTVRLNNTTGRGSQWAILPLGNGNYALMAQPVASNSNGVITRALGVTETDSTVRQYAYTTGVNMHIQWRMIYTLNIEVFADRAYQERYPSGTYVERINNAMETVREKYLVDLGIWINYTAPKDYVSWGDKCDEMTQGNYDDDCPHHNIETCDITNEAYLNDYNSNYNHKNIYNIYYHFWREHKPNTAEITRLAFIGHITCSKFFHMSETGSELFVNGLSAIGGGLLVVNSVHESYNEEDEILVVAHEIGHWYLAPDHYDLGGELSTEEINNKYGDRTFSKDCIYGENKDDADIISSLTICEGCRKTILDNISLWGHSN